jgi:hypothetical protein
MSLTIFQRLKMIFPRSYFYMINLNRQKSLQKTEHHLKKIVNKEYTLRIISQNINQQKVLQKLYIHCKYCFEKNHLQYLYNMLKYQFLGLYKHAAKY